MSLLSANPSTIPLLPRATTKLTSFSLLRLSLTSKTSKPFPLPLPLHNFTPLSSPSPPLLPPPRALYDIPISIKDEEYDLALNQEPWKGAIVYKRDASVSHVEYCTSLHRLALGWISSRVSADRAAEMGLKLPHDLNWLSDDEDEDEDEDEDNDDNSSGELNGQDVAIEGIDENGNAVSLSVDELKNAEISVKYDDDDDDEDDDHHHDDDEMEELMDTPVALSIDVTRRRGRIRLDGIIRTVIALDCNRCLAPAAQCVYLNFSLLLSEEPIGEPPSDDVDTFEELFDEANTNKIMFERKGAYGDGDEDQDIEWDDRLYFPAEEKEIDISKHVRDIIHLEVTMDILCSPNCKGVCLQCSSNLNISKCTCVKVKGGEEESRGTIENYGPLRGLRKKLEKSLDQ